MNELAHTMDICAAIFYGGGPAGGTLESWPWVVEARTTKSTAELCTSLVQFLGSFHEPTQTFLALCVLVGTTTPVLF